MIKGTVTNNVKLPARGAFDSALERTIRRLTLRLVYIVKTNKLSGQVLKRNPKGGRLSRSIHDDYENGGKTGVVGTNIPYARVHEYGGTFTIKEHMRMMKQAFGRPVASPREILIREHIAIYPERSFLRSALKDLEPEIQPAIQKATQGVVNK